MDKQFIPELIKAVLPACGAMVLIYIVTVNIQKIAAFFDKMLKKDEKQVYNDGLYDIYSTEKPGSTDSSHDQDTENDKSKTGEEHNG